MENKTAAKYSYSFPFLYKYHFRFRQDINFGYKYCDLYVPPKHKDLKIELLTNIIFAIDIDRWNKLIERVQTEFWNTINHKRTKAKQKNMQTISTVT